MNKVKYIVCFMCKDRNGKQYIQFFQYWSSSAQEALEAARITAETLEGRNNRYNWIIEGVYCKCDI